MNVRNKVLNVILKSLKHSDKNNIFYVLMLVKILNARFCFPKGNLELCDVVLRSRLTENFVNALNESCLKYG